MQAGKCSLFECCGRIHVVNGLYSVKVNNCCDTLWSGCIVPMALDHGNSCCSLWHMWCLKSNLKLQKNSKNGTYIIVCYFCHLMQRAHSLEKTLMLGKIKGGRRRGRQRMRWWMASPTWWTWVWASSRSWWWTGNPGCCSPWGCKESDTTEQLNWTVIAFLPRSTCLLISWLQSPAAVILVSFVNIYFLMVAPRKYYVLYMERSIGLSKDHKIA